MADILVRGVNDKRKETIPMSSLTNRDMEILRFINLFGFCEMPHLNKRFGLKRPFNYKLIGRLMSRGLVKHKRVFYHRHGVYWLSKKGASYTDLPPIKNIPLNTYQHSVLLIELYFQLKNRYPDAKWVSERELIWDKFLEGVGKKGHVADGLLIFPDGKKVSIELELTLKGLNRAKQIFQEHSKQFDIDEVWYFCDDKILPKVAERAAKKTFIKIFSANEYLYAKS